MRRKILTLLLPAFIAQGWAQGIYYERWIDNNRVDHQFGWLQEGEQTITADLTHVSSAGLHFLNILPYTASGEPGKWSQIAFMMPECWPGTSNAVTMEYWLSDNLGTLVRKEYTSGEQQFSIDISGMSYGLHFLNYRTFNERGEPGAWKKQAFYISNHAFDPEPVCYQYWIDNGEKHTVNSYTPGVEAFTVSIDGLTEGKHTFYDRICYTGDPTAADATFSETVAVPFEIVSQVTNIKGDVNGDGVVDVADIATVIDVMAGSVGADPVSARADVNEDGSVDVADIATIIDIMAGKGGDNQGTYLHAGCTMLPHADSEFARSELFGRTEGLLGQVGED